MYKLVVCELRVLRTVLMNPKYSKSVKLEKYHRTSGFVYGFYLAFAKANGTKTITTNMIDLTYAYLDAMFKEYCV